MRGGWNAAHNLSKCEWMEITDQLEVTPTTEEDVKTAEVGGKECKLCQAKFPTVGGTQSASQNRMPSKK
jgi:hypothetical protein